MPFAPQAPYAVWDELHNEACEEASMLMADAFFSGASLNAHLMEQGILNLAKWEAVNGYGVDVTAAETALILRDYFQLSAAVESDPTAESIRGHLSAGRLVLLPLAGRDLGNPYFRQPGPLYHMLVVRGHDPERREFVTNDPGTKRGEQYRYAETTLLSAVHDWPLAGKTKDDVTETLLRASPPVAIIVGRAGERW
ncbi:MAG: C39 family peptidase [bacterium]|nr:C39 family peptidase [bacterium]